MYINGVEILDLSMSIGCCIKESNRYKDHHVLPEYLLEQIIAKAFQAGKNENRPGRNKQYAECVNELEELLVIAGLRDIRRILA